MAKSVVLVTGASVGIGRSIADTLQSKNKIVIGASRSRPEGTFDFEWMPLDVSTESETKKAIKDIGEKYRKIDALINNAGIGLLSPMEETHSEEWKPLIETNVFGPIYAIQAALPYLRASDSPKIITISSLAGIFGIPYRSFYSASKFAVEGLSQALRVELKKFNIQICTVCPGAVKSEINKNRSFNAGSLPEYKNELKSVSRYVDASIDNGISTERVTNLVLKILDKKQLRPRYVVASPLQRSAPLIKRLLGPNLFEKMLMKANGMHLD